MLEQPGEVIAEIAVEDEETGDECQRPPQCPPDTFEDQVGKDREDDLVG